MTPAELTPLLLGSVGCLVLSLILNYAFYRGWIQNPRVVVPRDDYEKSVLITERNTLAIEKLAGRRRGTAT